MEDDETEISKEDLQSFIRDQLKNSSLTPPGVLEKYDHLKSLLEKKEKQSSYFQRLCRSVDACEDMVKDLYTYLDWEYKTSDSDDESTGCAPELQSEQNNTAASDPPLSTSRGKVKKKRGPSMFNKKAVVVLRRLSRSQTTHTQSQPQLQTNSSENESLSDAESDAHWQPIESSSESDFETRSKKRRKIQQKSKLQEKSQPSSQGSGKLAAVSDGAKTRKFTARKSTCSNVRNTSTTHTSSNADVKRKTAETTPRASTRRTATPQANGMKTRTSEAKTTKTSETKTTKTTASEDNKTKTSETKTTKTTASEGNTTQGSETNAAKTNPSKDNTSKQSEAKPTKTPEGNTKANAEKKEATTAAASANPTAANSTNQVACLRTAPMMPPGEVTVNMNVLARKRELSWQHGKITEIVTKDDGRLKYKVTFDEKGKSLVSGHHIAFDCMPKVEQLFIGARVVVKWEADKSEFMPGFMAELPNRKNRMRFLVFIDNHVPVYVGLPLLRLVCKPLGDPLKDIFDKTHRSYMREYLKHWPYPPQTQYKIGQSVNAEYDGNQQKSTVLKLDCSLMELSFESDKHTEWFYRGSIRLEHMSDMRKKVLANKDEEQAEPTSAKESS